MANVRRRMRNGQAEKWIADYFDQNRKRHIKTFDRKRDAEAWLAEATIEVRKGVHTPENKSLTVAEAAELWIERCETEKLEKSTMLQYRQHVRDHINPSIGGVTLAQLSTPMAEDWKDKLLRGYPDSERGPDHKPVSRALARKVLVSLKSILRNAQRRGEVAQNVAQPVRVELKKRDAVKLEIGRNVPSKEEITKIFAAAPARWRALIVTAALTGLRASELRGLHWDCVDFERRIITVRERANLWGDLGAPKSAAGNREVPMTPTVFNTLREHQSVTSRAHGLVFGTVLGTVQSHANLVNRGWYAAQLAAGITDRDGAKYNFHACRHFYASWAIEQGFSPKRLQQLLGHATISMVFDVYGSWFPSLEDDHAKFAAADAALMRLAPAG
jgi:integrase